MALDESADDVEPNVGERLAGGSRSVVYASGAHTVLKVPNAGTPDSWIGAEAVYCDAAVAAGVAAPRVVESLLIEQVRAVRFERIDGRPMWDHVADDPTSAQVNGVALAEVQIGLRSRPVPIVLPEMRSRLLAKLHLAAVLLGEHRIPVTQLLETLWANALPMALCHGDLHPKNVLMGPSGAVLVDWFDASRGPWIADVARTSLLLDTALGSAGPSPDWLPALRSAYLQRIRTETGFDESVFRQWRVVGIAARMAEGLQVDFTRTLLERELVELGRDGLLSAD
jgi:Ser/Thr protein kinase RdoA (MazF antagonist)